MQRRVFLLLAVLASGTPLLSEVNHTLGQVMTIFIDIVILVGVVVVWLCWEKMEVGSQKTKNNEEAGVNSETIQQ